MPILKLLILISVANGAPVAAKKLFGHAMDWPLDGGASFGDGKPWFGPSKTVRGIALSVLATTLAAIVIGVPTYAGAAIAAAAMAGDLFSSFVKRRAGRPSSSMALGLDQIPESLLPALVARWFLPVTLLGAALTVILFTAIELGASQILFRLRIRDQPY